MPQNAAIIWLHGLGDCGDSWKYLQDVMRSPHIKWVFPDAPSQPVSCNGGFEMPSWFDLKAIPVNKDAWDDKDGLAAAVAQLHKMVEDIEKKDGILSERIAIGGFSQGGCLSILSVLSSKVKLAGAICFSGWVAHRDEYPQIVDQKNLTTPIFWGHGEEDDKVLFSTAVAGWDVLKSSLKPEQLTLKQYAGMEHSSVGEELEDLQKWLDENMPQTFMLPELWGEFNKRADADAKKSVGNDHFKAKRYEEAIVCYTEAIEIDASCHAYFGNRAACYLASGKWESAAEDAKTSIELKADFAKGYARLATAQAELLQYEGAEATARKGLAVLPRSADLKRIAATLAEVRRMQQMSGFKPEGGRWSFHDLSKDKKKLNSRPRPRPKPKAETRAEAAAVVVGTGGAADAAYPNTITGIQTSYLIVEAGDTSAGTVEAGNRVKVHATGVVKQTGKKFWSTKDEGQKPFTYQAGVGKVIKGWDKGCLGMHLGESRKLLIPASEGYGSRGFPSWGIPADATLDFEITVLEIDQ